MPEGSTSPKGWGQTHSLLLSQLRGVTRGAAVVLGVGSVATLASLALGGDAWRPRGLVLLVVAVSGFALLLAGRLIDWWWWLACVGVVVGRVSMLGPLVGLPGLTLLLGANAWEFLRGDGRRRSRAQSANQAGLPRGLSWGGVGLSALGAALCLLRATQVVATWGWPDMWIALAIATTAGISVAHSARADTQSAWRAAALAAFLGLVDRLNGEWLLLVGSAVLLAGAIVANAAVHLGERPGSSGGSAPRDRMP